MLEKISKIKGVQRLNKTEQLSITGGDLCWNNVSEAHCSFCNGDFLGGYCLGNQATSFCLSSIGYTHC